MRILSFLLCFVLSLGVSAQLTVFRCTHPVIDWRMNGEFRANDWTITPSARPDILEVPCSGGPGRVSFIDGNDSLELVVNVGDVRDFVVLVPGLDSAFTRVVGAAYRPPQVFDLLAPENSPVFRWLQASAVPITNASRGFGPLDDAFAKARVVGLGEATHGQHETFELKRALTMHLIRNHGYRLVAYEASASSAIVCDDYIAGRNDDRRAALGGLSMLIWQVEENAALLDDLRAWNAKAAPADRVRFIGVDAQDGDAAEERLSTLLGEQRSALIARVHELTGRASAATNALFQGDRTAFDQLNSDAALLARDIEQATQDDAQASEIHLRTQELMAYLGMYGTRGGRDKAMAELLLTQLNDAPAGTRCVLWAHNAHVQKSAMAYMGTDELATGGHLHTALGEAYYALGFTFGEGGFQATAPRADGRQGFKRYTHKSAPKGSLEWQLAQAQPLSHMLDLRGAPADPGIQQWLTLGHGMRWWGGYNVPDDVDANTNEPSQLWQLHPIADFDGLVYLAKTTAAIPVDNERILSSSER